MFCGFWKHHIAESPIVLSGRADTRVGNSYMVKLGMTIIKNTISAIMIYYALGNLKDEPLRKYLLAA